MDDVDAHVSMEALAAITSLPRLKVLALMGVTPRALDLR
jgi:hypothetical protein